MMPLVPLAEIARSIARTVEVLPGQKYRTIGVKWWGEGAYERATIDGSQTAARSLWIVHTNDLIINKIWVRHGSTAIATSAVDGCAASGEFPTFVLDTDRVLPRWIHWLTKTKTFWSDCDRLSQGTSGKNRIKPELFLTIRIPLPPLDEQRRIVARIEELAARIEEARGLRAQTEQDAAQLLAGVFERVVHYAPHRPIGEVAPLVRRPITVKEGVEYPELGVRSFGKGTFHKPPLDFASVGTKRIFCIEPGDLVFSNVFAWEGAVAVVQHEDANRYGSHRFITCVPRPGVTTATFLRFFFLTPKGLELLRAASPGGAGRNRTLGLDKLARIQVPMPAYDRQVWFDQLQERMRSIRALQAETAAEFDALLASVLDRAFRGEL